MLIRLIRIFRNTPLNKFPQKHPILVIGLVLLIVGAIISFLNAFLGACVLLLGAILIISAVYYENT